MSKREQRKATGRKGEPRRAKESKREQKITEVRTGEPRRAKESKGEHRRATESKVRKG